MVLVCRCLEVLQAHQTPMVTELTTDQQNFDLGAADDYFESIKKYCLLLHSILPRNIKEWKKAPQTLKGPGMGDYGST